MIEVFLAFTSHFLPGDWNEVHPGVRWTDPPYMAAAYKNSEGGLSVALGFSGVWEISDRVDVFADAGLVTGYSAAPVVPMVRVGAQFDDTFRLFVAPAATDRGDVGAVVAFEAVIMKF